MCLQYLLSKQQRIALEEMFFVLFFMARDLVYLVLNPKAANTFPMLAVPFLHDLREKKIAFFMYLVIKSAAAVVFLPSWAMCFSLLCARSYVSVLWSILIHFFQLTIHTYLLKKQLTAL